MAQSDIDLVQLCGGKTLTSLSIQYVGVGRIEAAGQPEPERRHRAHNYHFIGPTYQSWCARLLISRSLHYKKSLIIKMRCVCAVCVPLFAY
jgi:hypothetical protein